MPRACCDDGIRVFGHYFDKIGIKHKLFPVELCKYYHIFPSFAGMFCIGITIGRGINGFIAMKLKDRQMIRMGQAIILTGIIIMILPFGQAVSLIGFSLIGLGCAPIYPCIIHSTPEHFGAERSQAIIGVQMASAYIGTCLMPPLFGLIANHISIRLLPLYLLIFLFIHYMYIQIERCSICTCLSLLYLYTKEVYFCLYCL